MKLAEYKPLAKIEELEEQNYNMIDERLNNGVEKFNREEEKKEQQEKPQARSSLKERLAAKQFLCLSLTVLVYPLVNRCL